MPDPNLTGALRASLDAIDSPLAEAEPNAVDLLLDRINENLAAGLPHKIDDETLRKLVDVYRAEALRWNQEQQIKASRPKNKKTPAQAIDILL